MTLQDTTSIIRIDHLFKTFHGVPVINDVSLNIPTNAILGLLGPNGAGKTTLLKIIAGLLPFDSGSLNRFQNETNGSDFYRQIGYCPQSPRFWKKISVREQLKYCADLYKMDSKVIRERIDFLLVSLGLEKKQHEYAEHLSGGMQKRLNLAMSLIHKPSLLLLDEPTANLDLESKEFVIALLKKLRMEEGITVICSSHDLDEISHLSTELIILQYGKVIFKMQKKQNEPQPTFVELKELYFRLTTQ